MLTVKPESYPIEAIPPFVLTFNNLDFKCFKPKTEIHTASSV